MSYEQKIFIGEVKMANEMTQNTVESVVLMGDLSRLTPTQKIEYHAKVCELVGLNPLTKPFEYLTLNGKTVLYAGKNAAEQLRKVHNISITECDHKQVGDMLIVTVKARNGEGREDIATAAINIGNLKGDHLANAIMKAETKAKRRVTLSICSLGMLDESELDTIPKEAFDVTPAKPKAPTMLPDKPRKSQKAFWYYIPNATQEQIGFMESKGCVEYSFEDVDPVSGEMEKLRSLWKSPVRFDNEKLKQYYTETVPESITELGIGE